MRTLRRLIAIMPTTTPHPQSASGERLRHADRGGVLSHDRGRSLAHSLSRSASVLRYHRMSVKTFTRKPAKNT